MLSRFTVRIGKHKYKPKLVELTPSLAKKEEKV
jgi:hypothetical protein